MQEAQFHPLYQSPLREATPDLPSRTKHNTEQHHVALGLLPSFPAKLSQGPQTTHDRRPSQVREWGWVGQGGRTSSQDCRDSFVIAEKVLRQAGDACVGNTMTLGLPANLEPP